LVQKVDYQYLKARLKIFPRNDVFPGASRALDGDGGVVAEEFVGFFFPGGEGGEDALEATAAREFEFAGFEGFVLLCFREGGDLTGSEGGEPFLVEVWLGCDEDVVVVGEFEELTGALFRLVVEVLQPLDGISGVDFNG